jgi:outer membrane protein W
MKKTLLLLTVFLLMFFPVLAQTDKGSWLMGGSAGLDYTVQTSGRTLNASLSPQTGYFLADNFALGLRLPLGLQSNYTETLSADGIQTENRTLTYRAGIGPFVRYYFGKSAIRPFINAGTDYQFSRTRIAVNGSEQARIRVEDSYSISGGAGMAYFISQFVGLESQLGYTYFRSDELNKYSRLGLSVGLQIYIPGKF